MAKHTAKALRSLSGVQPKSKHTAAAMSRTTALRPKQSLSHTAKAMPRPGRPTKASPGVESMTYKRRNNTGVPFTR